MKLYGINKSKITMLTSLLVATSFLIACSSGGAKNKMMNVKKDGDVTVPDDYRSWPRFVSTVDKVKTGQVREIYINKVGMTAKRGDAFPSGTVSIMEIYSAQKTSSGDLLKDVSGKLLKGKLSKVFVMEKGKGWGSKQPTGTINNGDWAYGAYLADAKTPATKDFTACRSCHLPLANKDYIARYDEHFDTYKR